jgi:light-regulated signal transduction histidine kinase (bacteriophytochrome)
MCHKKCEAYQNLAEKLGHDISNQLSIITGYLDLVLMDADGVLSPAQKEKITRAIGSAIKIKDMLTYSHD